MRAPATFKAKVASRQCSFYLPAKASTDVIQRANAALRGALAARETVEGLELMGL
jgi:hypothetical protein